MRITAITIRGDSEGATLLLAVGELADPAPSTISAQLYQHDDVTVSWVMTLGLARDGVSADGATWSGPLPDTGSRGGRLLQIVAAESPETGIVEVGPDLLALEPPDGSGEWETGPAALVEARRLDRLRSERFAQPLSVPGSGVGDTEFVVVMLAENTHLTSQARVPGIQVVPLQQPTLGADLPVVFNDVLAQLGFQFGVDPAGWTREFPRHVVAIHIPRVTAATPEVAMAWARDQARLLLDVIALNRGDAPRLLGGAVGAASDAGELGVLATWSDVPPYRGNLLGGVISGEEPHYLLQQWEGVRSDPRTQLWLSLHSDALSDQRWDIRAFRLFTLLESIGKEVLPRGIHVVDRAGNPRLMPDGRPYSVATARGAVYTLLQGVAAAVPMDESNFCGHPDGNLWNDVAMWTQVRNEVAHRGAWLHPHDAPPPAAWIRYNDQLRTVTVDVLVRALRTAAEHVLHRAMTGRL